MEDMPYEIESVRRFPGLRLAGPPPDETTILKFRHLLEKHDLGRVLFGETSAHLASRGYRLRAGTIMDAGIIPAPSWTRNRTRKRDLEMRWTKKGAEWFFVMKAHVGVGEETGLVHGMAATSANTHDVTEAHRCFTGKRSGRGRTWATGSRRRDRSTGDGRRIGGWRSGRTGGECWSAGKFKRGRSGGGQRCGPRPRIPSGTSNASSATPTCATAGWSRTSGE